ncbi:fimbria/pilus periplasmic chaperone [Dryocola clanedunensis]|uniref:fimbria/pilus periplasmic chaperone n=1 Tax=Cedecea sulfonylureivorans TaxID=3051154 RepID=UPI0019293A21|nr:fimbria/pilus periplasmic chaperone [Cedecea sulfonylureivorans]
MLFKKRYLVLALCIFSNACLAAMTITGTRIIFPGSEKEVSVRTNNRGKTPPLVQVWVDDGNTKADINNMKVPFLVTPPVYRVEPGKGQMVRLLYNGMPLPQDRESVFWFNMLEIPPVDKSESATPNKLELAFRTRIKIFYRPSTLNSSGTAEVAKLQFSPISDPNKGNGFRIVNPTQYYMSFDSVTVKSAGKSYTLDTSMLAPLTTNDIFAKPILPSSAAVQSINLKIINDYGAVSEKVFARKGNSGFSLISGEDKN